MVFKSVHCCCPNICTVFKGLFCRFCHSCILTWLSEGRTCPDDNCSLGRYWYALVYVPRVLCSLWPLSICSMFHVSCDPYPYLPYSIFLVWPISISSMFHVSCGPYPSHPCSMFLVALIHPSLPCSMFLVTLIHPSLLVAHIHLFHIPYFLCGPYPSV